MERNPHDEANVERRQGLQRDEEAFRLRQEEKHLIIARRSFTFIGIANSIYWLTGMLATLLVARFALRLFGANPENGFSKLIDQLSAPFLVPFSTLFISPTSGSGANIFDVNVLIAITVYTLLGHLIISLLKLFFVKGFKFSKQLFFVY